ncbi:MAG: hypothetical protein ACJASM_002782 [Salibacteraceae bacterium]
MKEYKSKVGYGILIPIVLLHIGILLLPILTGQLVRPIIGMTVVLFLSLSFILHVFYNTTYYINEKNQLLIKYGFIYNSTVEIADIKSIERTRNPISSPAASMDRIELKYGKWNTVIISPKDKKELLNAFLAINPKITVDLKGFFYSLI